jgi:hypothetical protein
LNASDFARILLLWVQNKQNFLMVFLKDFCIAYSLNPFWRVMFETRKVDWGEPYLHYLNKTIFVEKSFEILCNTKYFKTNTRIYTNLDEWKQQASYLRNMFEFIHHPKYGCSKSLGLTETQILFQKTNFFFQTFTNFSICIF